MAILSVILEILVILVGLATFIVAGFKAYEAFTAGSSGEGALYVGGALFGLVLVVLSFVAKANGWILVLFAIVAFIVFLAMAITDNARTIGIIGMAVIAIALIGSFVWGKYQKNEVEMPRVVESMLAFAGIQSPGPATSTDADTAPIAEPAVVPAPVDTSNSNGVVIRDQMAGWPVNMGKNADVEIVAPAGKFVLVNGGMEAAPNGKEASGCFSALVYPGQTMHVIVWDGNAEILEGGETAVVAYSQFILASRKSGDTNCQVWEVYGFQEAK